MPGLRLIKLLHLRHCAVHGIPNLCLSFGFTTKAYCYQTLLPSRRIVYSELLNHLLNTGFYHIIDKIMKAHPLVAGCFINLLILLMGFLTILLSIVNFVLDHVKKKKQLISYLEFKIYTCMTPA